MYTNYETDWCQRFGPYNTDYSYNIQASSSASPSYCYPATCCPCPICHKNIKPLPKLDTKHLSLAYDMPPKAKTTHETVNKNSTKLKKKPAKPKKTVQNSKLKHRTDNEDARKINKKSSKNSLLANSGSYPSVRTSLSESGLPKQSNVTKKFKEESPKPRDIKSHGRDHTKFDDCERFDENSDSVCHYKCSCEKLAQCSGKPKLDFKVVTYKGNPVKQIHQENSRAETFCLKRSNHNSENGYSQQDNHNRDNRASNQSPRVAPRVSRSYYSQPNKYPEQSANNAAKPWECNCGCCRKNSSPRSSPSQSYKHAFSPSKSCPHLDVINEEESENEDDSNHNFISRDEMEDDRLRPKMQKTLEDSCADFLNIICDNILESVQKSVDSKLKEFNSQAAEKFQSLGRKLETNETAVMRLCTEALKKMTEQNKANFEEFCGLMHGIVGSQTQMKKNYTEDKESQYEEEKNDVKYRSELKVNLPGTSPNSRTDKDKLISRTYKNEVTIPDNLRSDEDKLISRTSKTDEGKSILRTSRPAEDKSIAMAKQNNLKADELNTPKNSMSDGDNPILKTSGSDTNASKNLRENEEDDTANNNPNPSALMSLCYFCCHSCTKINATDSIHETGTKQLDARYSAGGLNDDVNKEDVPVNEEIKVWGLPMKVSPKSSPKCSPKSSPRELKSPVNAMCCHGSEVTIQKFSSPRSFTTFSLTPSGKTIFNCQVGASSNRVAFDNEIDNNSDTKLENHITSDNYDTSGYATEPEDNIDEVVNNNGRKKLLKKASKQYCTNHTSNQEIVNANGRQHDASEMNGNQKLKKQVRISSNNCSSSPTRLSRL